MDQADIVQLTERLIAAVFREVGRSRALHQDTQCTKHHQPEDKLVRVQACRSEADGLKTEQCFASAASGRRHSHHVSTKPRPCTVTLIECAIGFAPPVAYDNGRGQGHPAAAPVPQVARPCRLSMRHKSLAGDRACKLSARGPKT